MLKLKSLPILLICLLFSEIIYAQDYNLSPFGYLTSPDLDKYYSDLGVKWTRRSAQWGVIQSRKNILTGNYDWKNWEEHVNWDQITNMNLLITISLLGTPVQETGSYVPSVYPYDKANYLLFVENLVNRYKNITKFFQVENEPKPEIINFAELQKITYQKVKDVCPECRVVIGGYADGSGEAEKFDNIIVPILDELNGNYIDIFDIHWFGNRDDSNVVNSDRISQGKMTVNLIKQKLEQKKFNDIEIWFTESGTYSGKPNLPIHKYQYQSEKEQAASLLIRYISPLANGVKRVMWAWGIIESFKKDCGFFDYTGLIFDGCDCENNKYECGNNIGYDLGNGVKKLSYYTYKLMVEKLEGSEWDSVETIIDGQNNIYAYKFTKKNTRKSIYVLWWDFFNDSSYKEGDTIIANIPIIDENFVKITQGVPNAGSGKDLDEKDYPDFFPEKIQKVTDSSVQVILDMYPVFVEGQLSSQDKVSASVLMLLLNN